MTTDKILHLLLTLLLTITISLPILGLSTWCDAHIPNHLAASVGAAIAMLTGTAKEAVDYAQGRHFDFQDLLADTIGAAIGFLLTLMA